ncbi:hypothetical protein FOZ63_027043 [Perkinsus olseni]|uniref:Uncharacterized protein n=1 Tax=Perkinsus olseni TaxID=32597 RepID=A0A7J6NRQ6_PEROL|nr:hypothetical protein FOZ60_005049 [Perkinsus olseni]KAF4719417.1 hypothetical protein FOZ63_027043 [Perkinsus olseni]
MEINSEPFQWILFVILPSVFFCGKLKMYSFVSLQLPGDISLMSNNTCRLRWNDDKKLEVKLNPHFKSDGNIIAYSLFTDGAAPGGGTLRYHFGLENEDYFLLSLSRTGSTYVRCQTDKMKDASKFYTSVSPFAHLNKKRVAEKLVGMFPEQKNPGRSRKIFSFLAANPPQGYDTGIDWVVGFHYTVGSYESIDSVRELVGKWEDAQK